MGEQASEAPQLTFHMRTPVTLRSQADRHKLQTTRYELHLKTICAELHIPSSGILNVAESL